MSSFPVKIDLSQPRVVATVTQDEDLPLLQSREEICADLLEYRLDMLRSQVDLLPEIINSHPLPALITVRCMDEGGHGNLDASARRKLYDRFLPAATLLDTEITSLTTAPFADFSQEVRDSGAILVASFHDFSGFPGRELIADRIAAAYSLGADVAKIAVVVENMSDLFELVDLVEQQAEQGHLVSAMGMGPLGKLSRLVLAKAGSCLNYGYLRIANAPGQWPAGQLFDLIREI